MVRHNFTSLAQASHHQAIYVCGILEKVSMSLAKLPEECLRRIGIAFLAWSPCCFVQLVGLRPHLHERCPVALLSFDQFVGKIIHVYQDDTQSIAMRIKTAPRSSIITICAGIDREVLPWVIDKPIIVQGESAPRYVEEDYDRLAPTSHIYCKTGPIVFQGDCDGAKVRNLTLVASVECLMGSPQIQNCNIFGSGCIRISGHARPTISDCWIHADDLDNGTFGIEVLGQAVPTIMNNRFDSFEDSAIIMREQSSGLVKGNHIRMPDWPPSAIAFRIEHLGSMPPEIAENTVVDDRAPEVDDSNSEADSEADNNND
jgi:hypothetical protein